MGLLDWISSYYKNTNIFRATTQVLKVYQDDYLVMHLRIVYIFQVFDIRNIICAHLDMFMIQLLKE